MGFMLFEFAETLPSDSAHLIKAWFWQRCLFHQHSVLALVLPAGICLPSDLLPLGVLPRLTSKMGLVPKYLLTCSEKGSNGRYLWRNAFR